MVRCIALLLALVACQVGGEGSSSTTKSLPEIVFIENEYVEIVDEIWATFELTNETNQSYVYRHQTTPCFDVVDLGDPLYWPGGYCGTGMNNVELLPGTRVVLEARLVDCKGPIQVEMDLKDVHGADVTVRSRVLEIENGRVQVP